MSFGDRAHAQVFSSPWAVNSDASTDTGIDVTPQIATDGGGTWLVAWQSPILDVRYSRSTDDGATWSPLAAINPTPATRGGGVQLATDGTTWMAVWVGSDPLGGTDSDLLTAHSTDAGASWSTPIYLNTNATTDSGREYAPELETDGMGAWIVVWGSDDSLGGTIGADHDILYARSIDDGATWSPPAPLNTNAAGDSGMDRQPDIRTDGAGNWIAAWSSSGIAVGDFDILIARSIDAGVTWSAPVALNSNAASDTGDDYMPELATDEAGTWVAVWTSKDSLGGTIGIDEDILSARSIDGGVGWSAPAPVNSRAATDVGDDAEPQVTTDAQGTWLAIWYGSTLDKPTLSDDDIHMARSTDAGLTWSLEIPLNDNAGHDRYYESDPQVATDGAGVWLAAWDTQDTLGNTIGDDFDIVFARGKELECSVTPQIGCPPVVGVVASSLRLSNGTLDEDDRLLWKWSGEQSLGVMDFGNPPNGDVLSGTNYLVCIYDGASDLLLQTAAAAGGQCGAKACWKTISDQGFGYRDRERTPDGLEKIGLTTTAGRTKLSIKGRGAYLRMPALGSFVLPLRAQLQASTGVCWEATFSAPTTNDTEEFYASADE
jgi:hypothetical protein